MARYAIAGTLGTVVNGQGKQALVPRNQATATPSGDLVIDFDAAKFTSVAQLRLAADQLIKQLLGVGGLSA